MNKAAMFAIAVLLMSSVSYAQDDAKMPEHCDKASDQPAGVKTDDGILYGNDLDQNIKTITFADLISNPSENDGKMVLISGNVAEVCQEMGCWMTMTDGANTARVVTDHKFFLPKDIAGRNAVVFGTFKVAEISEQEAKHYNDESKDPTEKTEDITGPQKAYIIEATGIKILNPLSDSSPE